MKKTPKTPVPDSELRRISSLTARMRQNEAEFEEIANQRCLEVCRLAAGEDGRQKVTYARLAGAMGISEVAVYKILRMKGPKLRGEK